MSNVVLLSRDTKTVAERPPPESRLYRRIRLGSGVLVIVFTVLAVTLTLTVAALILGVLVYQGPALRIGPTSVWVVASGPGPAGSVAISSLPLAQRIAYAVLGALRAAPGVAILIGLRRLFGLYAGGIVFARENARQIKWIGAWLVVDAATPFIEHLVQSALRIEIDHRWFHLVSLQELVLGALVFVIAEVMGVGHQIEQERGEFI